MHLGIADSVMCCCPYGDLTGTLFSACSLCPHRRRRRPSKIQLEQDEYEHGRGFAGGRNYAAARRAARASRRIEYNANYLMDVAINKKKGFEGKANIKSTRLRQRCCETSRKTAQWPGKHGEDIWFDDA